MVAMSTWGAISSVRPLPFFDIGLTFKNPPLSSEIVWFDRKKYNIVLSFIVNNGPIPYIHKDCSYIPLSSTVNL